MEAYRKIQAARQKKKTPTKKEKDAAWKAIKERDAIIKALELWLWFVHGAKAINSTSAAVLCKLARADVKDF